MAFVISISDTQRRCEQTYLTNRLKQGNAERKNTKNTTPYFSVHVLVYLSASSYVSGLQKKINVEHIDPEANRMCTFYLCLCMLLLLISATLKPANECSLSMRKHIKHPSKTEHQQNCKYL